MNIAGLAARAALLREQMKKKPCKRCGMLYDPKKEEKCPHCADLDEKGLAALLEKKENEIQGNKRLGHWFLIAAVIIFLMLFLGRI